MVKYTLNLDQMTALLEDAISQGYFIKAAVDKYPDTDVHQLSGEYIQKILEKLL